MKYETTVTSKGTITIAAPLRKALGLKTGQKVRLSLDESKHGVFIDAGFTLEQLEAIRDRIVSEMPNNKKGLSLKQLRDVATKRWLAERIAKQK